MSTPLLYDQSSSSKMDKITQTIQGDDFFDNFSKNRKPSSVIEIKTPSLHFRNSFNAENKAVSENNQIVSPTVF